jgi:hypothetical protein
MSEGSDGRQTGPLGEGAGRSGKPPVPRSAASDPAAPGAEPDGQHRTERVPFPLPPLPPQELPGATSGPATGRLFLGGYPPRVPGAGPRAGTGADAAAPGDGRDDPDAETGGAYDGR